ncbi:MAG: hypothetical protein A2144_10705 [Chloroflexi bacterium RBG_16_50_9]|nr:MAG: hypothetical protein A2144_10705 [Chloroflexi bacterium RBG_16_50_9]
MAVCTVVKSIQNLTKYQLWKDIFDRFFAMLLLVVLSPLLILIAIGVMIDSPGKPLFCQERIGKDGRKFILFKFRSMYQNHDDSKYKEFIRKYVNENITSRLDENGKDAYELIQDPRVTRFGALLRRTSLDELPQLINVLKGEMAFIGPRPDIPFTVEMYQDHHRNRLLVKPGITGLWQVSGRRSCSFDDMVRLDIDYINRQSPALDARILLLTVREMLSPDGARDGAASQ